MAAAATSDPLTGPDRALSAAAVIDLVLGACAELDSAAATLYEFASGSLRGKLGSVSDLRRTLSNELFAPLLGDSDRRVEEFDRRGDVARASLRAGEAVFIITLARRDHGRAPGCWLVTAIARDQGSAF